MLDIISVGPGEAVLLTDDAKQAIDRADAVWCAGTPCRARAARKGKGRFRRWKVQLNRCVYPATQDRVPPCWFPATRDCTACWKCSNGKSAANICVCIRRQRLAALCRAAGRFVAGRENPLRAWPSTFGKRAVPRRADASADVLLSRRGAQSCVGAGEPEPRRAGKCAAVCRRTALLSRRADGGL